MTKTFFQPQGSIGVQTTSFKHAVIRLEGTRGFLKAYTVSVQGDGGISAQIMQDFAGTPYFTVFGTKLSTFHLSCADIKLIGCDEQAARSSDIQKIAAKLKDDARSGTLTSITIACANGPLMSGKLINMDFNIERPVPTYRLTVVGVLGSV